MKMKQTEIVGVEDTLIPDDWEVKTLGEVAPLQRGFDLPLSEMTNGEYPVVFSNGINAFHNQFKVKAPGVVTGRSGTIGSLHYVEKNYWPHNTTLWVTDFHKNYPKYIFYLFQTINWKSYSGGSGVPTLNRNDVHEQKLLLPPLAEQHRIAKALSDVDALISTTEKLIQKKKNIKQGAMQNLLTGKKRLPGFGPQTKSPTYKQTELGLIPDAWEIKSIKDFAKVYDGTHQTPHYVDVGIPFYSVENVTANDFEHTKLISEKEHRFLTSKVKIEKGDILMTRIGSIGDCKYIDWEPEASFYVSLALIKCDTSVDARFISYYSNSLQFKKELELRSLITAIPQKINLGPISEIILVLPPKKEQTAIANVLSSMDKEIETLNTKLEKYRNLKTAMMQQLLTGKIRLR